MAIRLVVWLLVGMVTAAMFVFVVLPIIIGLVGGIGGLVVASVQRMFRS